MRISKLYRDQLNRPLDTAIYWVEYVAKHRGAAHMHSAGQDLSFVEYHNLDILAGFIFTLWLGGRLMKLIGRMRLV